MNVKNSFYILTAVSILGLSCSPTRELEQLAHKKSSSIRAVNPSPFAELPRSVNYDLSRPSAEQFMALGKEIMQANLFFNFTTDPDQVAFLSWSESDRKVKAFLLAHSADPFISYYRQRCALDILCSTNLLTASPKKATWPIIAYYVTMLRQERNSSVAVYYHALNRLGNYWSTDERRAAIGSAIQAGQSAVSANQQFVSQLSEKDKAMFSGGELEYNRYIALLKGLDK